MRVEAVGNDLLMSVLRRQLRLWCLEEVEYLEIARMAFLASGKVALIVLVLCAGGEYPFLWRPLAIYGHLGADNAAARLDPSLHPCELRVCLGEVRHIERFAARIEEVRRDGPVEVRREAAISLEPAGEVLGERDVIAVAHPEALGVGGIGVDDLLGREALRHAPLPCGEAVPLESQGGDGLDGHGAKPLEGFRELSLPVFPETFLLSLHFIGAFLGGGAREGFFIMFKGLLHE